MDATLSDEQVLLAQAAAGLAQALGTRHPAAERTGPELDAAWGQLVALGLPSLRSPGLSGTDATGVEVAIVIEALGRTLSPAPALGQGVIVPELLTAAGADAVATDVAGGRRRIAPSLTHDLAAMALPATAAGAPDATIAVAVDAQGAQEALVVHMSGGTPGEPLELRLVPLTAEPLPSLDLTRTTRPMTAAAIGHGEPIGVIPADRWPAVEACALAALAADLVGVAQGALDDAVTHAADRHQFGAPIGSFQAVAHLAADAHVSVEGARSCLWHAAWALDRTTPDEALLAARTAKAVASRAGRDVVEAAVQILGGVAITFEERAHLRLRRTLFDRTLLGDERVQHAAIADARLGPPATSTTAS